MLAKILVIIKTMKAIYKIFLLMYFLIFLLFILKELFQVDISKFILPLLWILAVPAMYLSAKQVFSRTKDDENADRGNAP